MELSNLEARNRNNILRTFEKSQEDELGYKPTEDEIEKAKGPKASIGEIRKFGGRDYIRTADGWKFHGKGTGAKAQSHVEGAKTHTSATAAHGDADKNKPKPTNIGTNANPTDDATGSWAAHDAKKKAETSKDREFAAAAAGGGGATAKPLASSKEDAEAKIAEIKAKLPNATKNAVVPMKQRIADLEAFIAKQPADKVDLKELHKQATTGAIGGKARTDATNKLHALAQDKLSAEGKGGRVHDFNHAVEVLGLKAPKQEDIAKKNIAASIKKPVAPKVDHTPSKASLKATNDQKKLTIDRLEKAGYAKGKHKNFDTLDNVHSTMKSKAEAMIKSKPPVPLAFDLNADWYEKGTKASVSGNIGVNKTDILNHYNDEYQTYRAGNKSTMSAIDASSRFATAKLMEMMNKAGVTGVSNKPYKTDDVMSYQQKGNTVYVTVSHGELK